MPRCLNASMYVSLSLSKCVWIYICMHACIVAHAHTWSTAKLHSKNTNSGTVSLFISCAIVSLFHHPISAHCRIPAMANKLRELLLGLLRRSIPLFPVLAWMLPFVGMGLLFFFPSPSYNEQDYISERALLPNYVTRLSLLSTWLLC